MYVVLAKIEFPINAIGCTDILNWLKLQYNLTADTNWNVSKTISQDKVHTSHNTTNFINDSLQFILIWLSPIDDVDVDDQDDDKHNKFRKGRAQSYAFKPFALWFKFAKIVFEILQICST